MNEEIKKLLAPHVKDDVCVDDLAEQFDNLLMKHSDKEGGIYCVHMKSINGKPIRFKCFGEYDDSFALIKFGKAENYEKRFGIFGFEYDVIFKIPGSEKYCKSALFGEKFSEVFHESAKVATIKNNFGLPASFSPAPTEWRIVASAIVDRLKKVTMTTYQTVLESFTNYWWTFEVGNVTIEVGKYSVSNKKVFKVATLPDPSCDLCGSLLDADHCGEVLFCCDGHYCEDHSEWFQCTVYNDHVRLCTCQCMSDEKCCQCDNYFCSNCVTSGCLAELLQKCEGGCEDNLCIKGCVTAIEITDVNDLCESSRV